MSRQSLSLPPQTSCARCGREIESSNEQDRPRFRYEWIAVKNIFTDEILYYHHDCYNRTHQHTRGR